MMKLGKYRSRGDYVTISQQHLKIVDFWIFFSKTTEDHNKKFREMTLK